ncbi:aspartate/glutamate racemase family protein [Shimia sp. CNT1-13L.2]|uniref:maleate cis-trans isomerase family protein n=1 Tax=Shimia sp. CNT1-13L.2 TaxID=2959663 RepID=UPI0020CE5892|nr:aspartate/glutamate racemase family protein [Shimia sp. CNT1-13L.2]MCP9482012.1 aspartate/glutamate racemase family protein [Shimia sp. CNT1-13L.2]
MAYRAEFLDDMAGGRPVMGLLVLSSDEVLEQDMRVLLPASAVVMHTSRVENSDEITGDTLAAMAETLTPAARALPPSARFDVIGYGCTSGTAVIGSDRVAELVRAGARVAQVTSPLDALQRACASLGVSRLALLSPYVEEVSDRLRQAMAARGLETPVFGSFNESREEAVARISPASIIEAAVDLGQREVEAVFMSCTNLPSLSVIEEIEAFIGKPVLSSNQVLAWDMARRAGITSMPVPVGRLHRA